MARLGEYRRKRRFEATPEPAGRAPHPRRKSLRFVIQKHAASHLHYDFRLEWNGVLLSWAVPKGPSLDPAAKRLARAVEDHPLEYAGFEGIIPAGEYGGGTVMVWDRGTYVPEPTDVGAGLAAGKLVFTLHGAKLRGNWALVRLHGQDRRNWLLIKQRDRWASPADEITRSRPCSVRSGRSLRQIAGAEGGDVMRASAGDPPEASRCRMRRPVTRRRSER